MTLWGYIKDTAESELPSEVLYRTRERLIEVLKPLCEQQIWLEQAADGSATDFEFIDRDTWVGLEYTSAHRHFKQQTNCYNILEYTIEGEPEVVEEESTG
jgi:hypothetical protein